ncbi:NAD(P)/FAD-dependent oxidoreductase [Streptomyces sp. MUM 203J]|uniref:NAD(P)/FAD-dependent oxidoreductase n=1 Tax=Streptomyces sp. MUM 203J TaxID=2791990 RepID=UPI001F04DB36|nr:NAD(P)/FAD-dependent oxidoreductase [Streptomyces sp. MUM 203J]
MTAPADLAVIGAGPAGLAAAVTAADLGLTVTLLDAGERPGGQFYRHPGPGLGARRPEALHHGWRHFASRMRRLGTHRDAGRIVHRPFHHVWTVVPDDGVPGEARVWRLHAVAGPDETPVTVRARAVLLATGAYERQLPFPGWTLPGVVGAGGAQAMLKSGLVLPGLGVSPGRAEPRPRIVVAGSGPLLLAVAGSLAAAGARVPAVVEGADYTAYARFLRVLARNPGKLGEGALHGGALLRHATRLLTRHAVTAAHGTTRVEAVTVSRLDRDWRPVPGTARRVPCDALAVGHGLVPQLELATGLGCATRRAPDGTPALALDDDQATSVPGIWAAGETGGIGGADLALTEGELAATAIARALRTTPRTRYAHPATAPGAPAPHDPAPSHGTPPAHDPPAHDPPPHSPPRSVGPEAQHGAPADPRRTAALVRRRARLRGFADAMAAAHRPGPGWADWLRGDTEVCRCEEVTADRVREAVTELGARDARTVKLLTRAGMGWCQGRMCGQAVARLAGEDPAPDRRPLSCPVPLSHLAELPAPEPIEEPEA